MSEQPNDGHLVRLNMPVSVSDEFMEGVLSTAIEGGIRSWATITHTERVGDQYVRAVVREDDDDLDEAHELDRRTIADGLRKLFGMDDVDLKKAYTSPSFQRAMLEAVLADDAGEIDGNGSSAIVEIALFGEVRYC